MKIAIASAEMVPYVKVGGLADVTAALSKELARLGHEVKVLLPRPAGFSTDRFPRTELLGTEESRIPLGTRSEPVVFERVATGEPGLELVFIRRDDYFERPNPYVDPATGADWPDNPRRFTFYCKAIIESMMALRWIPDAIHLNDYQTGLVPILIREAHRANGALRRVGILYAIHNMGYQGIYPPSVLDDIGSDLGARFFYPAGPMEYYGKVNLMKAAILYADLITTVSERYAEEIQEGEEYGFGLEGVLRARGRDVRGILNGIDVEVWDPETDPLIPVNYKHSDFGGKKENKARLLHAMELPEKDVDTPIVAMITRLVDQKGLDLVEAAMPELMRLPLKMVVLGNGLPKYEARMNEWRETYRGRFSASLTFNEPLAHLIEAGSDFFLMPSRYEPCGLNQMYSLRYGTIPIVRGVGGLADTVREYDPETGRGNGFVFQAYDHEEMLGAIRRGLGAYARKRAWKKLVTTVMQIDHSWRSAALKYVDAYHKVVLSRA